MEIRRIVLFAALGLTTYLMLQAWNQDYGRPEQAIANNRVQANTSSDVPGTQNNDTVSETGDIPVSSSDPDQTVAFATSGGANSEFIDIRTDVLDLRIDLKGGDIEYVALPEYPVTLEAPNQPFVLLEDSNIRHFIAQSGLVGPQGPDAKSRPLFTSSRSDYDLSGNELEVPLLLSVDGVDYKKIFTFKRGQYVIDVRYEIMNKSDSVWKGNLFGQLKRDQTADPSQGSGFGMTSALSFARTTTDDRYEKIQFDDITDGVTNYSEQGGWIAFIQHYFVSAWIPSKEGTHTYYMKPATDNNYRAGFSTETLEIEPGQTGELSAKLYVGPKNQQRLAELAEHLDLVIDYGWLWWAAQPIFWLLTTIQSFVVNWGWSIILLTLTIKGVFYPLTASSARSMARMRKFSPKMQQLREQYGDDRQKMSGELMKLYKKEKINPMGGCLPIVIQMPVFIALYWVLMEAVELRQSPWIFWIQDLSVKDPYFILPILMAASMALQMSLTTQPNMDPMQAKMMKMMPWIFGVMFLWFPSGLVLYWLVNNLISISQQWHINRQIEKGDTSSSST